ncbi:hypothetical protein H0H93_008647 [Arthromyces matolae]|nr:hypothetical protein H0H93_008647 [Arthromyces matolae]
MPNGLTLFVLRMENSHFPAQTRKHGPRGDAGPQAPFLSAHSSVITSFVFRAFFDDAPRISGLLMALNQLEKLASMSNHRLMGKDPSRFAQVLRRGRGCV